MMNVRRVWDEEGSGWIFWDREDIEKGMLCHRGSWKSDQTGEWEDKQERIRNCGVREEEGGKLNEPYVQNIEYWGDLQLIVDELGRLCDRMSLKINDDKGSAGDGIVRIGAMTLFETCPQSIAT